MKHAHRASHYPHHPLVVLCVPHARLKTTKIKHATQKTRGGVVHAVVRGQYTCSRGRVCSADDDAASAIASSSARRCPEGRVAARRAILGDLVEGEGEGDGEGGEEAIRDADEPLWVRPPAWMAKDVEHHATRPRVPKRPDCHACAGVRRARCANLGSQAVVAPSALLPRAGVQGAGFFSIDRLRKRAELAAGRVREPDVLGWYGDSVVAHAATQAMAIQEAQSLVRSGRYCLLVMQVAHYAGHFVVDGAVESVLPGCQYINTTMGTGMEPRLECSQSGRLCEC